MRKCRYYTYISEIANAGIRSQEKDTYREIKNGGVLSITGDREFSLSSRVVPLTFDFLSRVIACKYVYSCVHAHA